MAYRELRDFTEIMRALGYIRPISVENFREPNFRLVADTLHWLVQRYDPMISISDRIDSEQDRVEFITSAVQAMAQRARIALKAKNLYAADGRAVRELLKIARVLYKALRSNKALVEAGGDLQVALAAEAEDAVDATVGAASRLSELTSMGALASEITTRGARLDGLLEEEPKLREARARALQFLDAVGSNLDSRSEHDHLQKSIRQSIESVQGEVEALERQVAELEADKEALAAKAAKKTKEKERKEKRMAALANQRPAFMDEYERLEGELAEEYEAYMLRFRNLHYLEHQLDLISKREKAKMEASHRALQRLQDKWRAQDRELFRGQEGDGGDEDSYSDEDYAGDPSAVAARGGGFRGGAGAFAAPAAAGGVPQYRGGRGAPGGRVMGSMAGGDDDDDTGSEFDDDLAEDGDFSSTSQSDLGDELGDDDDFSD